MTCLSKKSYKAGDVLIVNCKPFIKTLDKSCKGLRCDFCFKKDRRLSRCRNCKQMYYCDKIGQAEDWNNGHKIECRLPFYGEKICSGPNSQVLRSVCRIYAMLKLNPEKANEILPLPNGSGRSFNDLMDHSEFEKTNSRLMKIFSELKDLISTEDEPIETENLLKYFSIDSTNAFSIANETESAKIGSGIYVQVSVFDHSCKPNVMYSCFGTEMRIRAIGPIAEGESICLSYIATHWNRQDRRKTLRERFHFDCECERCTANLDSDVDFGNLRSLIQGFQCEVGTFGGSKLDFSRTLAKNELIVKTLRQLYHEYDERITNQYTRTLQSLENYVLELKKSELEPFLIQVVDHVVITYGREHFEYNLLLDMLTYCGYKYLL